MAYLLRGATLVTVDPAAVDKADLRISGGTVTDRGKGLEPQPGDEIIDLTGKLVMPGLVCAHTHLYSTLARGMPVPHPAPANFTEILELVWWRLDRALDPEAIYYSALVGALEAARAGTTCLFDHHSSPSLIRGSLNIVRQAVEAVGLRSVLCYEITDRGGLNLRDQGIQETRAWLESNRREIAAAKATRAGSVPFRGMVGAHASFTLSDETLDGCAALMREYDAGLHIHVAEDLCDVQDARSKYGMGIVERLAKHEALNDHTILAHSTHLDDRQIQLGLDAGVWFAHNPRSNMNNQVGYAPIARFSERSVLGTDGIGADMFEETRVAFFKGRDARAGFGPAEWLSALGRSQQLASRVFGVSLADLSPGSAADLIVIDYPDPTPMTADNLASHLIFGMNSSMVESVMVNGRFVIRDRRSSLDEELFRRSRQAAEQLWMRLIQI